MPSRPKSDAEFAARTSAYWDSAMGLAETEANRAARAKDEAIRRACQSLGEADKALIRYRDLVARDPRQWLEREALMHYAVGAAGRVYNA